jgi:pentatricopeptide repeat protein
LCLSGKNEGRSYILCVKKNAHINNLVELGKMEKAMSVARDMMNRGVEPSVITFNTLIKGWYKLGKMPLAMHVAKVMLKMNLYPNEITYSHLIRILSTKGYDDGKTTHRVHDQSQSDS